MTITVEELQTIIDGIEEYTYVCDLCGRIIFPTVTTNGNEINILWDKSHITGAGNKVLYKNVCNTCRDKAYLGLKI